jgi:uncharacterized RDD family membrane protein YckC
MANNDMDEIKNNIIITNSENKEIVNYEVTIVAHPWRRYFARTLDVSIYEIIWTAVTLLVLRWSWNENLAITLLNIFIPLGMMLLIEPLLLSKWGTTIGKWVFGLVVRDSDGNKLRFGQAFERTLNAFRMGMGYNLPIFNIVRLVKSYNHCMSLVPLPWEEGLSYEIKDRKVFRILGYIGLIIIVTTLSLIIFFQAQMPINKGNITAQQYYENCNDIIDYNNIYQGIHINDQGVWEESTTDNIYNYDFHHIQPFPRHELTITNGVVSGVKIEVENKAIDWITGYTDQKYIAFMSFVAAQKEMNFINLPRNSALLEFRNDFVDYSFVEAGIRVTNKVEYSGYNDFDEHFLIATEGMLQNFHMTFTMEKVD